MRIAAAVGLPLPPHEPPPRPAALVAVLLSVASLASGCGSSAGSLVAGDPPATCRATVMGAIERVASRAYDEVARGRVVSGSQTEVARAQGAHRRRGRGRPARRDRRRAESRRHARRSLSCACEAATARSSASATDRRSPGPTGVLRAGRQIVGRYSLAVQGDAGYTAVVHGLTGAVVLVRRGSRQLAGLLAPGPAAIPGSGADPLPRA